MKLIYRTLILIALISVATPAQNADSSRLKPILFNNVTVIDATGRPPMSGMTVLVMDGRISAIARGVKFKLPADTRVVDGSGKYLIPGLWDMHVHAWNKTTFVPLFVANGITGVRDTFGSLAQIKQWRKEIQEGTLIGPRIIAAGQILDGPKPIWPGSIAVSSEAEAVKAVNKVKEDGSDFVKVYALLARESYFAIAAEAKRLGMVFAGHVPESVTVAEASDAGQKSIEHMSGILVSCSSKENELRKESLERAEPSIKFLIGLFVSDPVKAVDSFDQKKASALFARLKKNGTWMSPTLVLLRALAYAGDADFRNDVRLKYMPPTVMNLWAQDLYGTKTRTPEGTTGAKKVFQKQLELLGAMHRAGVGVLAGTDTPNPYIFPGFSLHDELELLVKAGLKPMEALQAATRNPARYLGMLDVLGTIEKGKMADLVLLDANPLADINNTRKIRAVVLGGRLVDRAMLDEMLAKVEAVAGRK